MPRQKRRPPPKRVEPISIELLPKQADLLRSDERIVAFIGGYGSGKSYGGACKAIQLAVDNAGLEGMLVSATYKMLHRVTLSTFLRLAKPMVAEHHRQNCYVRLYNGSLIWYGSADTPGSLEGSNLSWFWGDEARLWPHEAYRILLGRLRVEAAPRLQGVITTTPSIGWLRDEFDGPRNRQVIRSSSGENWHLADGYVDELLESYSPAQARAYIDGEWVVLDGAVFPEFDAERHIIHYKPDPALPVIGGLDFGYRWPAVVYGQVLPHARQIGGRELPAGSLVIFDEDVTDSMSTEGFAHRVAARYPPGGALKLEWIACDPAGVSVSSHVTENRGVADATALRQVLRDQGLSTRVRYVWGKGSRSLRSINTGVEACRARLHNAKGETSAYFSSSLLGTKSYRGIIKAIQSLEYRTGTNVPKRGEPANQADHVVDAWRYLVRHLGIKGASMERYV